MPTLLTRTTRAAATLAVLAGAVVGLATPATAAPTAAPAVVAATTAVPAAVAPAQPPAETWEDCAAPVEGVQLCRVRTDVVRGDSAHLGDVHAELRTDAGVPIQAGLLTTDACSASCTTQSTAVGRGVATLSTDSVAVGKGTGYYRVTGTWVVAGHQHTAVV